MCKGRQLGMSCQVREARSLKIYCGGCRARLARLTNLHGEVGHVDRSLEVKCWSTIL